jgi:hypothetical protein
MHRLACAGAAIAIAASSVLLAQRGPASPPAGQRATAPAPARRISTAATCGAELGTGVKTRRRFCDVVIAREGSAGITITIPAHRGAAILRFDLHNRFTIPSPDVGAAQAFTRQMAVVAVIRPTGGVVDRAAVVSEFRTVSDLFDQISGGGAGSGPKAVAPGQAEPIEITIPTGLSSVSIVGVSLEATNRAGRDVFDAPGRPIAIVSNVHVEYTPAGPEPPAGRTRFE